MSDKQYPRPWWFSFLLWLWPSRCREIPEAANPDRLILRQFSIVMNRRNWQLACLRRIDALESSAVLAGAVRGSKRWVRVQLAFWRAMLWIASAANVYLQQFASAEDPRFMHCHPYRLMIAIGLWGRYLERRIAGCDRWRRAPYAYTMDGGHVHHVQEVTAGHTSIFIGLGRAVDGTQGDKHYYGVPQRWDGQHDLSKPTTGRVLWSDHIRQFVKRI